MQLFVSPHKWEAGLEFVTTMCYPHHSLFTDSHVLKAALLTSLCPPPAKKFLGRSMNPLLQCFGNQFNWIMQLLSEYKNAGFLQFTFLLLFFFFILLSNKVITGFWKNHACMFCSCYSLQNSESESLRMEPDTNQKTERSMDKEK